MGLGCVFLVVGDLWIRVFEGFRDTEVGVFWFRFLVVRNGGAGIFIKYRLGAFLVAFGVLLGWIWVFFFFGLEGGDRGWCL